MLKKVTALVVLVAASAVSGALAQEIWLGKDGVIRSDGARAMLIDGGVAYLATRSEIYKTKDVSGKWEPVFFLPAGENEITCLGGSAKNIYIGTKRGLYRSGDYGRSWGNIFRTFSQEKNDIICVERSPSPQPAGTVFIGTRNGVFSSADSGNRWNNIGGNLRNRPVNCILPAKDAVYAGSNDGLYVLRDGQTAWERIFAASASEPVTGEEVETGGDSDEAVCIGVSSIAANDNRVYIGVENKVLFSEDSGKIWRALEGGGLKGRVNSILLSANSGSIYCATTKGVFEFSRRGEEAAWSEIYKGMPKAFNVAKVLFDGKSEKGLWAVTEKGVYRLGEGAFVEGNNYVDVEKSLKTLKIVYDNEPSFKDLRRAALKYAELDPDKIRTWRSEARLAALVPKVSFGIDNNMSNTYEIYTSATKDYVINGPDDITKGWDVSVSWELGDMIWSDDQTNIDVRSRLTTQLRNDVLDDLRRVYYERKRLQAELATNPPKDLKARMEKELRIEEFTQAIDDLTGNYFSEHLKK